MREGTVSANGTKKRWVRGVWSSGGEKGWERMKEKNEKFYHQEDCTLDHCWQHVANLDLSIQVTWLPSPRSVAQVHDCLPVCGAPCWVLLQHTLSCCDYSLWSSVLLHAFFVLCVYLKFGHHPHPLGYLCAKLGFFRGLHCWASPWRKINHLLTHSPNLFDASGTEVLVIRNYTFDHARNYGD